MSVKMNVNAVDQDECEQRKECELGVPSSGEECKPAANNVRMTTCMMEDVNVKECVWSKKGVCKTHNIAGRKVCKTFNEWKLKKNGLYGYVRRQKTSYICMMGVGHTRENSSKSLGLGEKKVSDTARISGSGRRDNWDGDSVQNITAHQVVNHNETC